MSFFLGMLPVLALTIFDFAFVYTLSCGNSGIYTAMGMWQGHVTFGFAVYMLIMRGIPVAAVSVMMNRTGRCIPFYMYMAYIGFVWGFTLTMMVVRYETAGILLAMAGLLPHTPFYLLAMGLYLPLGRRTYRYSNVRRRQLLAVLFVLAGIAMECFFNPYILKIFFQEM